MSWLHHAYRVSAPDVFAHLDAAPEPVLRDLRVTIDGRMLIERSPSTVNAGQLWCVVGPNGASKSTWLSVLAGLRLGDGDSVMLDGTALADWSVPIMARRRAFPSQILRDSFFITVYQAVVTGRHPHLARWEWESDADVRTVDVTVSALYLQPLVQRNVRMFSGGERQRVAMAIVMAWETRVLLLDEPVAHFDLYQQVTVLRLLREGCCKHGWPVMLTVHDLNLMRRYVTYVLLMDGEGQTTASIVAGVLTPEHYTRALRTPIVEAVDSRYTALIPDGSNDD